MIFRHTKKETNAGKNQKVFYMRSLTCCCRKQNRNTKRLFPCFRPMNKSLAYAFVTSTADALQASQS
jgi:hypothetical protein